jgi:hypothetical protein
MESYINEFGLAKGAVLDRLIWVSTQGPGGFFVLRGPVEGSRTELASLRGA